MTRHKQTAAVEEAQLYLRNYVYDDEDALNADSIQGHKINLEKVWAECIRSIKQGNGKISALRTNETGRYERFDAADARIVAKYIKKRLTRVKRIIAETPIKILCPLHNNDTFYQNSRVRHSMIYVQRAVKRKQRIKAKKSSQYPLSQQTMPEPDALLELELLFKNRVPHRHGWGREYRPTRATWHRHDDNRCWKNKKCSKQYLIHFD